MANARPGSTIVVPVGRYILARPHDPQKVQGCNADPTTGDLNLTAPTVLRGAGRDRTVLDVAPQLHIRVRARARHRLHEPV
ncbi:hypothetical protein [Nocardia beijingensis]|uniref:Uncharacterized protein n=1 Tax=Nocardia beijingensis TaxID=95162 RepID=A0ABW7W8W7_9NOCA